MTGTPAAGEPARTAPAAKGAARTAPADRGRTVVADRAVRRIAERAAAETDLAGRRARVTHGTATVHGRRADVSVDVRLPYPAVLGEAGERVRGRMADRVAELSGLTVRAATVHVRSLAGARTAPQPPPACEDVPSGGRSARRPRSARRIPAALVALTAAAACAFLLYDVLAVHLAGRRPAGVRTAAVDWLAAHGPGDTAVVAGGAVAAALGVWLLCLALTPGLRGVLPMTPVPGRHDQRAVLDRTAVAELVRDAASAVPGVAHVRVRCGRRRVRVRARLAFGDRPTARTTLRAATDTTLATLGLPRSLTPRITLRPDPHWRPPNPEPPDGEPSVSGVARRGSSAAEGGPVREAGSGSPGEEAAPGPRRPSGAASPGRPPGVNGPGASAPPGTEAPGAEHEDGVSSTTGAPSRNAVNRALLGLTGAALLAGGGWPALTSDGVGGRLPGWWPAPDSGTVLLDRAGLADLRGHGWWTPVVVAGTVCALLLSLAWFQAQFRRGGGRRLPLAGPPLTLRSRALADVVARRAEAADGVRQAHVSLPAGKKRSRARVRVLLEPGAEPGPVLRRLTHGALDEARASLAPHPLAVRVRMSVRTTRERRAR